MEKPNSFYLTWQGNRGPEGRFHAAIIDQSHFLVGTVHTPLRVHMRNQELEALARDVVDDWRASLSEEKIPTAFHEPWLSQQDIIFNGSA